MRVARQRQANRDFRIVAGLGSTGLSCARHFHARGVPFAVVDSRAQPPGLAALRSEMPGVEFFIGDCPSSLFRSEEHTSELKSQSTISYAVG